MATASLCRFATNGHDGWPHLTVLAFVWYADHVWVYSLVASERWRNLERDARCAVVVDTVDDGGQGISGVEMRGRAAFVGDIPRLGVVVPELEKIEELFMNRFCRGRVLWDGRHAWVRVEPTKIVTWRLRDPAVTTADPPPRAAP